MSFSKPQRPLNAQLVTSNSPVKSPPTKVRKIRENFNWILTEQFPSEKLAHDYIDKEGQKEGFSGFGHKYGGSKIGHKVLRCKGVIARAKTECDYKLRIVFPCEDNENFRVEWNSKPHTCMQCEEKPKAEISQEVKDYITTTFNAGVRGPKKFRDNVRREIREGKLEGTVPKFHQIKYFLTKLRDQKFGKGVLSLGELERWCIDNKNCPDDLDKGFVIGYKACYGEEYDDEKKRFWYLVSTRRLLTLATEISTFCADTTHKILYQGFPVPLFGTVDANKSFRGIAFGVTSNETKESFTEMIGVSC